MHYVYILKCEDDSYYTGYSTNPAKRFEKHKSGKGAKYTRSHKPVSLEMVIEADSKSEALKMENEVKKLSHIDKQNLINFSKTLIFLQFMKFSYSRI